MKITKLKIENFKAIKKIELDNLSNNVLIAGPNGCGKSCIFDSVRLLKSLIGGYQNNEWHLWFNEFQIKPQSIRQEITKLFQTEDKELKIEASFTFNSSEKDFLKKESKFILEHKLWKRHVPDLANQHYRSRPVGVEYVPLAQQISQQCEPDFQKLIQELSNEEFLATFVADRNGKFLPYAPKALQLAFSVYEKDLGVIDYHGPHRNYQKEVLNNISLNIQTNRQSMKNHSLYNYQNKYNNMKQELAGDYIRRLLTQSAGGVASPEETNLIDTLKELFNEFFPGKKFLGPKPNKDGGIDFPVKLANEKIHDINDLSSGEKEVLYGYLRLKNSAPKNSIILLDEPELHLNPRLISGLPHFYKKHLGDKLGNQLWLVTHSDEFLRQAMTEKDYQVYHLHPPSGSSNMSNQIKKIDANNDLEKAIIDLVGDLATYAPNKKIVFLEGESSNFDKKMIEKLFPEFQEKVNLIPVGSKHQVVKLHKLLEETITESELETKFFSIVDRDLDDSSERDSIRHFVWDRYHIENYLLEEDYLTKAIDELTLGELSDEKQISSLMIQCAKESIKPLINHSVRQKAWKDTFSKAKLDFDPNDTNAPRAVYQSIKRNLKKIEQISDEKYLNDLKTIDEKKKEDFNSSFENNTWKLKVRGRDVLKKLVSKIQNKKISYESLKNITITLMVKDEHKPKGMEEIIEQILDA